MTEAEYNEIKTQIVDVYKAIHPLHSFGNPIDEIVEVQLPFQAIAENKDKLWQVVSLDCFAIFWMLSLDNIYVPVQVYEN